MTRVQKQGNSLTVTIPAQVARIKGWQKGTEVYLFIDDKTGKVVMEKLKETKE